MVNAFLEIAAYSKIMESKLLPSCLLETQKLIWHGPRIQNVFTDKNSVYHHDNGKFLTTNIIF
jgi:hypothetical protein